MSDRWILFEPAENSALKSTNPKREKHGWRAGKKKEDRDPKNAYLEALTRASVRDGMYPGAIVTPLAVDERQEIKPGKVIPVADPAKDFANIFCGAKGAAIGNINPNRIVVTSSTTLSEEMTTRVGTAYIQQKMMEAQMKMQEAQHRLEQRKAAYEQKMGIWDDEISKFWD